MTRRFYLRGLEMSVFRRVGLIGKESFRLGEFAGQIDAGVCVWGDHLHSRIQERDQVETGKLAWQAAEGVFF